MAFAEVIECHTISGDFDYMLKVICNRSQRDINFTDKLMQVAGVEIYVPCVYGGNQSLSAAFDFIFRLGHTTNCVENIRIAGG